MRKHLQGLALFITASALFLLCGALPAFAQSTATCTTATPAICTLFPPSNPSQIRPQIVATSPTAITTVDAYISLLTFNNTTGGPLVVTITDRQGTPVEVPGSGASIAAGQSYVIAFPGAGYWCPGGFVVSTTATGVKMYGAWRQ